LAKECYSMKPDLLTNATVVDDAIRSTSDSSGNEDDKESPEPDCDVDQLEEKQEEESGRMTTATNKVF
jgi:hypothetical protein